jgi:hypothetical protein
MSMERAPFRLAIRAEGKWVNAYIAKWETMEDAKLLGSIARAACDADPTVFEAFKDLVRRALAAVGRDIGLGEVGFIGEQEAPAHERSGRA